jgi:hypothetical protein
MPVYKKTRQKPRSYPFAGPRNRRPPAPPPPGSLGLAPVAGPRIVPRSSIVPGMVVWAHVPFEHTDSYKTRPAVVVGRQGRDVVLLPCTTSPRRHQRRGYIEIRHWQAAGLTRPTGVRRACLTLDYLEIVGVVGSLAYEDAAAVLPASARPHRFRPPSAEGGPDAWPTADRS